ncbi:DoxX family protein [Agrococcus sp. SGAir0287]|uniref:DoxX family protein n=1 Tax=Agrococcus sp. SGAir0287 TaxID=2070347 RepID=UPI0010CD3B0D|nr:DoxX family protein [Agrococcus sp. SGAir0287]QCR18264.1 hypothetical protein C1N71_01375 [Agrococcus sp. SGAir0287]
MSSTAHRTPLATDAALAMLRIVLGGVMLAHGLQKLLGGGIVGTAAGFRDMGVPFAELAAPAVIAVGVLGGAAMIAGLLVPLVGIAFVGVLGVAAVLVHGPAGFFAQDGGFEHPAVLAVASAAVAVAGSGRLGLDAVLAARLPRRASRVGAPATAR